MTTLIVVVFGVVAGIGLWLTAGATVGWQLLPTAATVQARRRQLHQVVGRSAAAILAGVVALAVTGWPVAAVAAGAAVPLAPRLVGAGRARQQVIARTEAIATWAESIRDTIAAAAGLEEAVAATAVAPPAPIETEVRQLVRRLRHRRLVDALTAFGQDVDHPSADLVVAALSIAARMEAADLTGLLSRLAESIRDDATMRVKVETSRARLRTAAQIIGGSVGATVLMLLLVSRDYLDAYDTLTGQLILTLVIGVFACGGWLISRMSQIDTPQRFVPRPAGTT